MFSKNFVFKTWTTNFFHLIALGEVGLQPFQNDENIDLCAQNIIERAFIIQHENFLSSGKFIVLGSDLLHHRISRNSIPYLCVITLLIH